MLSRRDRLDIMHKVGNAVDSLVVDLYSTNDHGVSTVQEPEISSRVCQRLEDRLDKENAGNYLFRVTAQSLPDRGPRSLERVTGADIYMSISLEGADGFDKGVFIQAKYDRNLDILDIRDAMTRMKKHAGSKGSYVWVYTPDGVKVLSAGQVDQMKSGDLGNVTPRSVSGFTGRILDCYAGTQTWGIRPDDGRRRLMRERLVALRVKNGLDVQLQRQSVQRSS